MASNNDLAVAVLRVYRARLEAERVGISTAPDVNASLNSGINRPLSESSAWSKTSGATLSTSYEVDLWGKLARQRDAAEWASQASEQDLQTARLTLLANAATNYWRIGFLNQQIGVSQASIAYAKQTLRLANARYRAGSISALDVVNAEQNVLTQESRLLTLQHERQQALNEQAVLLGVPSGQTTIAPARLPTAAMPQISTGIPANVLSRRPDLSAKELRLRAALANVDEKRLQYYPAFSLTGSLGASSSALLEFLRNPTGSLGAGLTLPFLQWRQMGVDIKIARNDYEQQVLEFRQALYKAMGDVNNAPVAARTAAGARGAVAGLAGAGAQIGAAERGALPAGRRHHYRLAECSGAASSGGAGGGRKPLRAVPEPGENLSGIRRFIGPLIQTAWPSGQVVF